MHAIRETTAETLNAFVAKNPRGHLLQSFEWGEFQKSFGEPVHRIVVEHQGNIVAAATLIEKTFSFEKHFLYCPRGPVLDVATGTEAAKVLFEEVTKVAKERGSLFVRMNPEYTEKPDWLKSAKKSPNEMEPRETSILDLSKTEDELLAAMKSKTRYNIRLALKKGVRVTWGTSKELVEKFLTMNRETAERDNFTPHADTYYEKQIALLGPTGKVKIFLAEVEENGTGTPLAANIVSFFGNRVTYVHGASSNAGRNFMAPFALQWAAIREAKVQGFSEYDFWGITVSQDENHPWQGITRFKRGFGGSVVQYIGAYDRVFKPLWYQLYRFYKTLQK